MLLIFLHFINILGPVEGAAQKIFNPFFSGFYATGAKVRSFFYRRADQENLADLAERLKGQVNQLVVENARLKALEEENAELRKHLNFLAREKKRSVMASIISRGEPDGADQTIVLDRGSKDGLETGLPVVNGDGLIIGKIIGTKDHLSQACLVSGSRCRLASSLSNKDKTMGIAQGEFGLTIRMDFIPQTEEVGIGDLAITSGLEKNIPKGLVIGQVRAVNKESKDLWQSASIEPLVDFNDLTIVSVLLP